MLFREGLIDTKVFELNKKVFERGFNQRLELLAMLAMLKIYNKNINFNKNIKFNKNICITFI